MRYPSSAPSHAAKLHFSDHKLSPFVGTGLGARARDINVYHFACVEHAFISTPKQGRDRPNQFAPERQTQYSHWLPGLTEIKIVIVEPANVKEVSRCKALGREMKMAVDIAAYG